MKRPFAVLKLIVESTVAAGLCLTAHALVRTDPIRARVNAWLQEKVRCQP